MKPALGAGQSAPDARRGTDPDHDDDSIAQTAADWLVQLSGDDAAERERAQRDFEAWKDADPAHAAAAAGMERFLGLAHRLGSETGPGRRAARGALTGLLDDAASSAGRKRAGRYGPAAGGRQPTVSGSGRRKLGLMGLLLVGVAAWFSFGPGQPAGMFADHRTAAGEQRALTLADGSRLLLAGSTAVDVAFDGTQRRLSLVRGTILVEVAADPSRPFEVTTDRGTIAARGTRFLVRRLDGVTEVTQIESKVVVTALATPAQHDLLLPGEQMRLDASGAHALASIDPVAIEEAFRRRRLVVQDEPLSAVLEQLAQERPGYLRYDAARLAGIRISAVLPLDDTDRALSLLRESFPQLRVRQYGNWLTVVESR